MCIADVEGNFVKVNLKIIGKANEKERSYFEFTAVAKDGTEFPVMGYTAVIKRNGYPIGIRGFLLNITDRKKIELEIIKAKEEAEQANVMKS